MWILPSKLKELSGQSLLQLFVYNLLQLFCLHFRVLDGGVVLLDGSAGVEAQTMTVWRQAQRYEVPCIAFINKLDKPNSDLDMTLKSMKNKLDKEIILTQIPLKDQPLNGK